MARNADWRTNYTLAKADVATHPQNARLHHSLAYVLINERLALSVDATERNELVTEAREHYLQSLEIYPKQSKVHTDYANLLAQMGKFDSAEAHILQALEIRPGDPDMAAKLPMDPDVVTGKLENGLTYYIRNNHKPANKVELRLVVKAGSILENNDQQGLAHFMEHMNFNGTKNFEKNELVSYLQSIGVEFGADLNAYTSFDQTVYILPIPTDKPGNLEKGFQIIEDWAHNALLTNKDIDDERGVVLEESRLGKGADDRMLKKYFPKLAAGSLYAERLPIGKDDILKNFKYETIRSFYKDWYRPDLQAVVVVGDIEVAKAKKMITDHFAGLKNPAKERPRNYVDVAPRAGSEAMVVTDKEATNSVLQIAFPYFKEHDFATMGDYKYVLTKQLVLAMLNRRLNELAQSSNPPFPYAAKEELSNFEKLYNERNTTESANYVEEYIRAFLDNEPFPGVGNKKLDLKKGKEKQSLIMAFYSGEVPYSEDLEMRAEALAEVLNIKVIEEMREKMGAIYGGGFRDKLLAATDAEIKKLIEKGPEQKDVDKVKSQWHEKYVINVKKNEYWLERMEMVLYWGRDKDRVLKYESYVEKLTPADIQATAKELLDGKNKFVS
eukprot:gene9689-9498_t